MASSLMCLSTRSTWRRASSLRARDNVDNPLDIFVRHPGMDRNTQYFERCFRCYGKVVAVRRGRSPVHGKLGNQRIEIASHEDFAVTELLIQGIARERVVVLDEDRKIGVVRSFFPCVIHATNARHI